MDSLYELLIVVDDHPPVIVMLIFTKSLTYKHYKLLYNYLL